MNLPNKLTVARIFLSPVFMVFFLIDNLWSKYAAFLVFVVASLTDVYDGYIARKTGIVTNFGKFMDPLADKLLTSMALISLVALDLPYVFGWMVVVIVAREIFITGLRTIAAYRGLLIPSSTAAKWKTVFQMVFVNLTLVHIIAAATNERFGTPLLIIGDKRIEGILMGLLTATMLLTLLTGLHYLLANREFIKRTLS
ncbi:MAG: CDP-diacylglycerol--glycerol-3-phosphate 3-phosphatidyltransferase [Candidatus Eisenbacteria bacterium]